MTARVMSNKCINLAEGTEFRLVCCSDKRNLVSDICGCSLDSPRGEFKNGYGIKKNAGHTIWEDVPGNGDHAVIPVQKNSIDGEFHAERMYPLAGSDQQPLSVSQGIFSQKAFHPGEEVIRDFQSACHFDMSGCIYRSHRQILKVGSLVTSFITKTISETGGQGSGSNDYFFGIFT
jgi:hypothetical protein